MIKRNKNKIKKSKNNLKKTIIFIAIFLFVILFSTIFAVINLNNSKIFSKITVNNVNISYMTKDEATETLQDLIDKKTEEPLTLTYEDYETTIYLSSLDITYDITSTTTEAYSIGRVGNIIQNNYSILNLLIFNKNIEIDISLDEETLDLAIDDICSNLPGKVVQPSFYIEDENLIIKKGSDGVSVNIDEFKQTLETLLANISETSNNMEIPVETIVADEIDVDAIYSEVYKEVQNAYYIEEPFEVCTEVIGIDFDIELAKSQINENPDNTEYEIELIYTYPDVTVETLDIDIFPDLLATFSTRYDASDEDRSTNLELAAEKISGTIVSPRRRIFIQYNRWRKNHFCRL